LGLARWFADKVATEARLPKYVQREVLGMGFEPETGALRVKLRQVSEDGTEKETSFRFVPELDWRKG
jgi:hypothetical protein